MCICIPSYSTFKVFQEKESERKQNPPSELMENVVTKQSIPLLTPYKMGRFNLSHRYAAVYVIYVLPIFQFPMS